MSVLCCDYSFARPSPTAIKAAGYVGVLRYLSNTSGKNLSATERDALFAAGLGIGLAWESTATRATQGAAAGAADATAALAQAQALGYPTTRCPIYFAVDEDVAWPSVSAYFTGAMSVRGVIVGAYGSIAIVQGAAAAGVPYRWQAEAWSGSTVASVAHLYQRVTPSLIIPGGGYDEDVVLVGDYPWWTATTPPPAPVTPPRTVGGTVQVTTVVVPTDANGNGWALTAIPWSTFVSATPQGSYPPVDGYWSGRTAVQDRTGKVLVNVMGAPAHSTARVFVAAG